jgi:ribose 5-phosphate isomerase RpiB
VVPVTASLTSAQIDALLQQQSSVCGLPPMSLAVHVACGSRLAKRLCVHSIHSPQGMSIVANKWPHVYAALCTSADAGAGCRAVNNANVLCLGGAVTPLDEAMQ